MSLELELVYHIAPTPQRTLYRVKNDTEVFPQTLYIGGVKYVRPSYRVGLPCVYTLEPTHKVVLTKELQELSFGIFQHRTPSMSLARQKNRWRAYLGSDVAFSNKTGFDTEGEPRADFINGQDLTAELPAHDKIRVCGEWADNPQSFISGVESGDVLIVDTIDANNPPSLQYVLDNPHLYFRATTPGSGRNNFPQGDGEPVFVPLLAYHDRPPVTYPLDWLVKV